MIKLNFEEKLLLDIQGKEFEFSCKPMKFTDAVSVMSELTSLLPQLNSSKELNLPKFIDSKANQLLETVLVKASKETPAVALNSQYDNVLKGPKRMAYGAKLVAFAFYHNFGDIEDFLDEILGEDSSEDLTS